LLIVGCGGWSRRKTLFGADHWTDREDSLLSPERDAAKIRAFFVHPDWARRGIGSMILVACERAAADAGFTRLEIEKGPRSAECHSIGLEDTSLWRSSLFA
jgi:GNAT superfamily N-acetyltransferase